MADATPTEPCRDYHLVSAVGDEITYKLCTRDEVIEAIKKLRGDRTLADKARVFIFRGARLPTTAAPYVYMLEEGYEPTPLFVVPTPGAVSVDGELGVDEEAEQPTAKDTGYQSLTKAGLDEANATLENFDTPLAEEIDD